MTRKTLRDRRELLSFGLAGLSSLAGIHSAAGKDAPPSFSTQYSQFTEMPPPADVGGVEFLRQDGSQQGLASYAGRAVLLSFWASWCPPCRRELPILARMQNAYAGAPFVVAPVALDRNPLTSDAFIKRLGLKKFFTLYDPESRISNANGDIAKAPFPLFGMPVSYVIDRRGKRVGYLSGEADWSSAEAIRLLRHFGEM